MRIVLGWNAGVVSFSGSSPRHRRHVVLQVGGREADRLAGLGGAVQALLERLDVLGPGPLEVDGGGVHRLDGQRIARCAAGGEQVARDLDAVAHEAAVNKDVTPAYCTRDEDGPLDTAFQEEVSNHPKLL